MGYSRGITGQSRFMHALWTHAGAGNGTPMQMEVVMQFAQMSPLCAIEIFTSLVKVLISNSI